MHGPDEGVRLDLADDPLGERPDYRSERPPAISSYLEACGTGGSGCAAAFDAATDGFEQWVATEKWLPERYLALIDHAGWREEVPSGLVSPLPSYGLVLEGQKLLLLDAKVRARKGDHAGVRDLLARDLRFWRRVFESSDTLLTKMIAKAAIDRHFSLGNLVLRSLPPESVVEAIPEEWHAPISNAERSMLRCMVGEWVYTSALLRNVADDFAATNEDSVLASAQNRLAEPFFQPQATINAQAEYYSRFAAFLNVPLDRYEAAVGRTAELAQQTFPPRSVYNVMGQILIGMGLASYDGLCPPNRRRRGRAARCARRGDHAGGQCRAARHPRRAGDEPASEPLHRSSLRVGRRSRRVSRTRAGHARRASSLLLRRASGVVQWR